MPPATAIVWFALCARQADLRLLEPLPPRHTSRCPSDPGLALCCRCPDLSKYTWGWQHGTACDSCIRLHPRVRVEHRRGQSFPKDRGCASMWDAVYVRCAVRGKRGRRGGGVGPVSGHPQACHDPCSLKCAGYQPGSQQPACRRQRRQSPHAAPGSRCSSWVLANLSWLCRQGWVNTRFVLQAKTYYCGCYNQGTADAHTTLVHTHLPCRKWRGGAAHSVSAPQPVAQQHLGSVSHDHFPRTGAG